MNNRENMHQDGNGRSGIRKFRVLFMAGLTVALLAFGIVTIMRFSHYLNQQLFLERQTHLLEITEKVSEIVDVVIDSSWSNVQTCEQLLLDERVGGQEALLENLENMKRYIQSEHTENSVILAFDQTASYYTSDRKTGHWNDPSIFLPTASVQQVVIAALPYLNVNDTYMVFVQRIQNPIQIEGTERTITHIAAAVKTDALKDAFAVSGFSDRCYTFIVNAQGRRLYKNTYLQEFIDGYNILTAMEKYEILNGGTLDDLKKAVGNEQQACLEFLYEGTSYYVGTALIPAVSWEVMLFVPTEVLGANTSELLNRTSQYFVMIFAVVMVFFIVMLSAILTSRNDKKLMEQQKETNALLVKAAHEAEQANQAKSQFLSRMSHDIRTPINGIMGMTDIAMKHIDSKERTVDCLSKIDMASQHLLSLVNDVLDMSRAESGKTELSTKPLNMREVLNKCAIIVSGELMDRNVAFITEFGEFAHPHVLGDELRLNQILINILGNAVKFTMDGGKIRFSAEEVNASDTVAEFRFVIEDSGKGMQESFLEHIFEPFSQEHGQDRSTYVGTGLGMAITKQFVDLMGGSIRAESKLNEGSKFTVILPFTISREQAEEQQPAEKAKDLFGMKVLLVEDNAINMEIAQCLLEEEQVMVTTAENGQEAVEIFAGHPPGTFDAILMDIMMPVMDGIEACQTIRAMGRTDAGEIPIIAMTANAYEEDAKRTKEAGMNEHLSKPIDGAVLLMTLAYYYRPKERGKNEEDTTL